MNISIAHEKRKMRRGMRAMLAMMSADQKIQQSCRIVRKLSELLQSDRDIKVIASFSALVSEPDLSRLLTLHPERKFLYPLCEPDGKMDFYHIQNEAQLRKGMYGILEPDPTQCQRVDTSEIDCFLCPSFAYTHDGERLGKGGGYYDRILPNRKRPSLAVGVVFSCQMVEDVPTEGHDCSVDRVVHG